MEEKVACEVFCYDEDKVNRIQADLNKVDLLTVSKMLKAVANENRTKIIYALCQEVELCVCDIAIIIDSTVANASHHLRTLYKQNVVKFRKEGKLTFYSLGNEQIKQILMIALTGKKEVKIHGQTT